MDIPASISDTIAMVLRIDNAPDALAFYLAYVAHVKATFGHDDANAAACARHNIGYCLGQGMSAERQAMWGEITGARPVDIAAFFQEVLAAIARESAP